MEEAYEAVLLRMGGAAAATPSAVLAELAPEFPALRLKVWERAGGAGGLAAGPSLPSQPDEPANCGRPARLDARLLCALNTRPPPPRECPRPPPPPAECEVAPDVHPEEGTGAGGRRRRRWRRGAAAPQVVWAAGRGIRRCRGGTGGPLHCTPDGDCGAAGNRIPRSHNAGGGEGGGGVEGEGRGAGGRGTAVSNASVREYGLRFAGGVAVL